MKKLKVKSLKHLMDTMATTELTRSVIKKIRTTPIKHNHIIVNYSDEGICIFEVIENTPKKLLIEFISTAS